MDKLLHERLREHSDDCAHFICADYRLVNISRKGAQRIADEIERFYIPRPLDDEGIPVMFGDEYEYDGNPFTARKMVIYPDCRTTVCDLSGGGHTYLYNERVKRHRKVFDSNGMEIKVGDVVYHVEGIYPSKVEKVTENAVAIRSETGSKHLFAPDRLTHKEPDSLEKLRDDMIDLCGTDGEDSSLICDELADCASRLTALMERDA